MTYFVHETAVVDAGAQIGEGTKIWHFSHIMSDARIGKRCTLGQNVLVSNGVVLGDNVKVQNNVSIYTGVRCESDVFIGPSVVFTNVVNPRSAINRKSEFKPTIIRKGATIGANATIICGVELGAYSFVGAGAVLVADKIEDFALYVGNPAKHIGWMSKYGQRLYFDDKNFATCPESGQLYKLNKGKVSQDIEK